MYNKACLKMNNFLLGAHINNIINKKIDLMYNIIVGIKKFNLPKEFLLTI